MKKKQLQGKIMFGIGLIMILISAGSYLFNWEFKSPVLGIMGLIFVVVGQKL